MDDLHPHCFNLFEKLNQVLSAEINIRKVIVAGCFNCYFIGESRSRLIAGDKYNYYYLNDGEKLFFRTSKGQTEALVSLKNFLENISLRYKLVFIGDNPVSENFNPSIILMHKLRGDSIFFKNRYPHFSQEKFQVSKDQLVLDSQLSTLTPLGASYISMVDIVCPGGICKATDDEGLPIYKDGNHIRPVFVREVAGTHLMKYLR